MASNPSDSTHQSASISRPTSLPGLIILIIGDTISFLVFAALGRSSHGFTAGFTALPEIATTAAPFLLGWLLAAPFAGAYRALPASSNRLTTSLRRTSLAWVLAWPLGLALRALYLQRGIPVSFAIVTFITNLLILNIWRAVATWLNPPRQ
ncbi:MAG: DUF3054 domain-containing protein [Chloroflexaceae bacterium]|nr:DUF3054 domain-containing protein [Chloroflexaceae bacterium]